MISFTRGLVLRKGERTLEFERDLGNGEIQLKYLDNYEIRTFTISGIYKEILKGIINVVRSVAGGAERKPEAVQPDITVLPIRLNKSQEALIAFRMHYIKAAIRWGATCGSRERCREVLTRTDRPRGVNDEEAKIMAAQKVPSPSTLARWLKLYQQSGGNAFALCDRRPLTFKPKRLSLQIEKILEGAIVKHYLQSHGSSMRETYLRTRELIEQLNRRNGASLTSPSQKTVERRIREIPEFTRDSKRYGVAYARNKWRYSLAGDQSTRILERAEIDHTLLDLWVLDPRSGVPLGRPWITVIIDRMSGYLLGLYISFYGPSSATVANTLKASILPKDEIIQAIPEIQKPWTAMGVAETYVVDNGMEFHSHVFRRIAWNLCADLIYNPVRQPWLKAAIERVMRELNRVLPLRGKVFAPIKNAELPDPKKTSAILFDDLCTGLIQWAAEIFPYRIHPKTLVRPIDLWEEGRDSGLPPMLPTSLRHLELATGISAERTIDGDGVFFQYLRYNSVELQDYCRQHGRKFRTEVRFNPDDLGFMNVLLPNAQEWLPVPLQRPGPAYGSGLSLLQHQINRMEAGERLNRRNAEEELMRAEQRNRERWSEAIRVGVKVRKNSDLIRQQGLTSAKLFQSESNPSPPFASQMEVSPIAANLLPEVVPFKSFTLNEDIE